MSEPPDNARLAEPAETAAPLDPIFDAERRDYALPGRADQPFDKRQVADSAPGGPELPATLYLPREKRGHELFPAVMFVHGGGWSGGNRGQFARHAAFMAANEGFAALCISYRLSGQARYPACVADAAAAVRWLRARAGQLGIDAGRVAIAGSSAGAHLAALVATLGDKLPAGGAAAAPAGSLPAGSSCAVQAAVLYNGIFALPAEPPDQLDPAALVALFGGTPQELPDIYRQASPIHHVSPTAPPCLLIHGQADRIVSCRQSQRFAERLGQAGVPCELDILPGVDHGQLNDERNLWPCLKRMIEFLRRRLPA